MEPQPGSAATADQRSDVLGLDAGSDCRIGVTNVEPIKITFFKKEACDNPTPQGYRCTFTVMVASANTAAGMYNNISMGEFYKDKDSGKWAMRPPF